MIGPIAALRRLFDALDEHTSDQTTERKPYANTRPRDGVYSITNTQSAEGTYAAAENTAEGWSATGPRVETAADCPNPATCVDCAPRPSAD